VPDFPKNQLLLGNFFEQEGQYDLIIEQTFFCSFEPTVAHRRAYAQKMNNLLVNGGKLVGLWFDIPLVVGVSKRPFGGTKSWNFRKEINFVIKKMKLQNLILKILQINLV